MIATFRSIDLSKIDSKIRTRVISRAIQRTTQGVRHQAVLTTGKELRARRRDIRGRITFKSRAGRGHVDFSGWSLPLSSFSPKKRVIKTSRGKRRGVTVNVKGQRKIVPGHFLVSSGGRKKVVRRKGEKRFPLVEAFTTGVSAIASNPETMNSFIDYAEDRFAREVVQNLRYQALR